tara:strand:- start:138 stop:401 length:264 start_codon:yes stop_codon:yes gene_type:complete
MIDYTPDLKEVEQIKEMFGKKPDISLTDFQNLFKIKSCVRFPAGQREVFNSLKLLSREQDKKNDGKMKVEKFQEILERMGMPDNEIH